MTRRSTALIEDFTGGDPGTRESLGRTYEGEGAENLLAAARNFAAYGGPQPR